MTTLRTLECLVAAAALHMSQPALSRQIAALEKELGAPVAERLWRGVRITAAGRATAEEARVALRAAEQAVQIGQRVARAGISAGKENAHFDHRAGGCLQHFGSGAVAAHEDRPLVGQRDSRRYQIIRRIFLTPPRGARRPRKRYPPQCGYLGRARAVREIDRL